MQNHRVASYTIRHHPIDSRKATLLYYTAVDHKEESMSVAASIRKINKKFQDFEIGCTALSLGVELDEFLGNYRDHECDFCLPFIIENEETKSKATLELIMREKTQERFFGVTVAHVANVFSVSQKQELLALVTDETKSNAQKVNEFEQKLPHFINISMGECDMTKPALKSSNTDEKLPTHSHGSKKPGGLTSLGKIRKKVAAGNALNDRMIRKQVENGNIHDEWAKQNEKGGHCESVPTASHSNGTKPQVVTETAKNDKIQRRWHLVDQKKGELCKVTAKPFIEFRHLYTNGTPGAADDHHKFYKDIAVFEFDTSKIRTMALDNCFEGTMNRLQLFFSHEMHKKPGLQESKICGIIRINKTMGRERLRRILTPRQGQNPIKIVMSHTVGHINSFFPRQELPSTFKEGASFYIQTDRTYVSYFCFVTCKCKWC